jgi:hypothetical protein
MATLDAKALNKFSRQNAALGAETTAKLIRMRVIVHGLRGVGIEVAKNLALQGVGGLTLCDPNPTRIQVCIHFIYFIYFFFFFYVCGVRVEGFINFVSFVGEFPS